MARISVRRTAQRGGRLAGLGAAMAALALVVGVVVPAGAQGAPGRTAQTAAAARQRVPRLNHVFIIMLENHSFDTVIGDPNMPYLNRLARTYGQATQYYGVTHPSEPNYIAATSGSTWDNNTDNPDLRFDHYNIVDELTSHHLTWAAYMQSMPRPGYAGDEYPANEPLYVKKHNPFALYTDIADNPARMAHIKPYAQLAVDLRTGRVANYVWISPDTCDDLHGGVYDKIAGYPQTPCPYNSTNDDPADISLKHKADAFIKRTVQMIMASKAWTGNSAIFITVDEGSYTGDATNGGYTDVSGCCDSPVLPAGDPDISPSWPGGTYGGGRVAMVVISRHGPRHATDATAYNHYSMLLTIEQGFRLPAIGYASDRNQVKPMWPLIVAGR